MQMDVLILELNVAFVLLSCPCSCLCLYRYIQDVYKTLDLIYECTTHCIGQQFATNGHIKVK